MFIERFKRLSLLCVLTAVPMLIGSFVTLVQSAEGPSKEKVKVLYHQFKGRSGSAFPAMGEGHTIGLR
jgi:hypothetical protein